MRKFLKPSFVSAVAGVMALLSACAHTNEVLEDDPATIEQSILVPDVGQACAPPDTTAFDHNEVLSVAAPNPSCGRNSPTQNFAEWDQTISALPISRLKTTLQVKMLSSLDSPACAIASVASRETFLRNVRAPLPITPPFSSADATLGTGWLYEDGGAHRAVDFSSNAGSFKVRAVADGTVIGIYFDGPPSGGGNTVVIEHTGQNGKKAYSFYMHLRNGMNHDMAAIRGIDCTIGNTGADLDKCEWYKKSAKKGTIEDPNRDPDPFWGTDLHVILVVLGQAVKRGQLIAHAGNTMAGSGSIDSNGDPTSTNANIHLHFALAVPLTSDPKVAVAVDPYGVYNKNDSDACYTDILKKTYYPRLFAPYLPDYYDVPWDIWSNYGEYINGMSYRPVTLSGYLKNGAFYLAGATRYSANMSHYVHVGQGSATISQYAGEDRVWVPRETRARIAGDGFADFDVIVLPRAAGEKTAYWYHLTQAQLNSKWDTYVVARGYSIGDFFAYRENGVQFYAVLFTTDAARANWLTYGRSKAQVESDMANLPSQLRVAQVVADETVSPPVFSMITRQKQGLCSHVYTDAAMSGYSWTLASEQASDHALDSIQVYANGSKFNAVFSGGCP